jgi:Ca-activated chloride channel family protein
MYENGVSVSTFGMGLDFDEDLLSSVAYGSGGSYYYISRPDDIFAALSREFHIVSRTVASGIKIIIRPLGGCRFESAPGHQWRMENGSAVIGLGDLSAGETRTLIAKVNVPTGSIGSRDIADVSVLYQNAITGEADRQNPGLVKLLVVDDTRVHRESIDTEVQGNKAVIESSALMNEAAKKVDEGDKDGALSIIRKALGSLKAAPESPAVKSEIERVQDYSGNLQYYDELAPAEQEEVQKEMKYRNYKELHQQ